MLHGSKGLQSFQYSYAQFVWQYRTQFTECLSITVRLENLSVMYAQFTPQGA